MEKEYVTLREEILGLLQKRDDYTRFAYTIVAAIWTASYAVENAYIVFLGMFILMPIAVRVTDAAYSSTYISAYLSVFHESKSDAKWETMNERYREKHKRNGTAIARYLGGRADFVMLQLLNAVIFWIYRKEPILTYLILDIIILIIQLLLILFACYQCYRSSVVDRKRADNIKYWEEIKRETENTNENFKEIIQI